MPFVRSRSTNLTDNLCKLGKIIVFIVGRKICRVVFTATFTVIFINTDVLFVSKTCCFTEKNISSRAFRERRGPTTSFKSRDQNRCNQKSSDETCSMFIYCVSQRQVRCDIYRVVSFRHRQLPRDRRDRTLSLWQRVSNRAFFFLVLSTTSFFARHLIRVSFERLK